MAFNYKFLVFPLLLLSLVLLFFWQMVFTNLILARGDTFLYFYPYWHVAQQALLNGRLPLWNPDIFMGVPLLANSQMGFFYPLNWLVWGVFDVPTAVKASIVLHIFIASLGTYQLGRARLGLNPAGATVAAGLFALGGYLTAQVEHVNQIQGLAWLPFILAISLDQPSKPAALSALTKLAGFLALQLAAGHTQTAFISGVAFVLWQLATYGLPGRGNWPQWVGRWLVYGLGALLALALVAIQLAPTLELMGLSSRQGGLTTNEVLSFSWHPLLFNRALLPHYSGSLFTEYVAFVPLTAYFLMILGLGQWRTRPELRPVLLLLAVGLVLALGRFTPLYYLLAYLPGFNFFRVPARWLVLYGLSSSLLAGLGWQTLQETKLNTRWPLTFSALFLLGLMGWGYVAPVVGQWIPVGAEAVVERPLWFNTAGQLLEMTLLVILLGRYPTAPWMPYALGGVLLVVQFGASRTLPYHQLTTPEAYFDQRPPSLRLQALNEGQIVPGRFLSLSHIFFDPGDQAEINTIYSSILPEQSQYDYTIAIKQKEILAPNLSMVYGLPSIDGFDGGILPTITYTHWLSQTLLNGQTTTDGRLREFLPAVPEPHLLDMFNVQYIITDKVLDEWHNGVYFDRQHSQEVEPISPVAVGYLPPFTATHLLVLSPEATGEVMVETVDNQQYTLPLTPAGGKVWSAELPNPVQLKMVSFTAAEPWVLEAATLVHTPDEQFQALTLGQYRLIHSGDVKIYENLDVLPRIYAVDDAVRCLFSSYCVNPVEVVRYTPEEIVVNSNFPYPQTLVVLDAFYPGWEAEVDGQPAEVFPAGSFFRLVYLPAHTQQVVLRYKPASLAVGQGVSAAAGVVWLTLMSWYWAICTKQKGKIVKIA